MLPLFAADVAPPSKPFRHLAHLAKSRENAANVVENG
jgi:hypothetical protein